MRRDGRRGGWGVGSMGPRTANSDTGALADQVALLVAPCANGVEECRSSLARGFPFRGKDRSM